MLTIGHLERTLIRTTHHNINKQFNGQKKRNFQAKLEFHIHFPIFFKLRDTLLRSLLNKYFHLIVLIFFSFSTK